MSLAHIPTEAAIDARVIDVYDRIADFIANTLDDAPAADIIRRAVRLFVEQRDISFQVTLVALLGQATSNRERADVTRAGEWLRRLAAVIEDDAS